MAVSKIEVNSTSTTLEQGLAKVWADINAGQGGYGDSFNTTSITDNGTGDCTVTIVNDMSSTNYSANTTVTKNHDNSSGLRGVNVESKAAGSLDLECSYANTSGVHTVLDLETDASITIHGDLA
tara:strand:- start:51 stop:422 length:372 start_codon:yes stop_codon:yes gene_type:complete